MDKTSTQRQSKRTYALDKIARARGWHSWSVYGRNVKNGVIDIAQNPTPGKDRTKIKSAS